MLQTCVCVCVDSFSQPAGPRDVTQEIRHLDFYLAHRLSGAPVASSPVEGLKERFWGSELTE